MPPPIYHPTPAPSRVLAVTLGFGLVISFAGAGSVAAQYDREGRYVPSPLGQPADPYARPIPNYSGKPGAAIGTPRLPRAYEIQPPTAPLLYRAPETVKVPSASATVPLVPLSRQQCDEGWLPESNVPRVEFNRRCARMRRVSPEQRP